MDTLIYHLAQIHPTSERTTEYRRLREQGRLL
jgi:hypothetical protein